MRVEQFTIAACCGRTSQVFKTDRPININDIAKLASLGFRESPQFTKAGILYMDDQALIVKGPIGSDRLTVTCKIKDRTSDCAQKVNDFEALLQQLG